MTSIAIIDIIGLTYDGDTLKSRGLGGSESAVILMSKELVKLGFSVTVFNNCIDRMSTEGVFDGVRYLDLTRLDVDNDLNFDVVISSRTVIPFLHPALWREFQELHPQRFANIKKNAKFRAVWMHDTFCRGDHHLEGMVTHGDIHEIFTLSDFHTSYAGTCNHGMKRMFEVLKKQIFQTRNGAVKYLDEVDITKKDPDLFVYNASVTKGMLPLVTEIWPKFKQHAPKAKLKVIGGYYRFRENADPDEQEITWRKLVDDPYYKELDIEFTGIIKQSEIAEILSQASYMAFPGAFPETFGISTLESLLYNTPLITTRFGALEETAIDSACYKIDYAIEPNNVFPHINKEHQITRFVDLMISAYSNRYLHQQKMYACNQVKDISTWDTVAIQWKQHIYKKLGLYLPVEAYREAAKINSRVRQVFGRRFANPEENYIPRTAEQRIVVVTPVYNAENYIGRCLDSVISQDYSNWKMLVIDDCSNDGTVAVIKNYLNDRVSLIQRDKNMGAVYNQITTIKEYCRPDDIVILLDGDDALINDNQIFQMYNNLYDGSTDFTYGSCWSEADNIPLIAQPYPEHIKKSRSFREHRFNWNMPYTHLRTFKAKLILDVDDVVFKNEQGDWYRAGGDVAVFYEAIERADPDKIKAIPDVVYLYNDKNPINDYKIHGEEQTKTANSLLKIKDEKFSVIIPTMWRAQEIFQRALNDYVDNDLIEEIIIINNAVEDTPVWDILLNSKIKMLDQETNIKVNPAWNLGVDQSKNDRICIANDDIWVDPAVFSKMRGRLNPGAPAHGIISGEPQFRQPVTTDYSIDFVEWKPGDIIHCFGQFMFINRRDWIEIPSDLEIFFGDDFIVHNSRLRGKPPVMIYNIRFESPMAQTSSDKSITEGFFERESKVYAKWQRENPVIEKLVKENAPMIERTKTILIAVPTNKYIEPETMKSIYDLEIPHGYRTEFQFFYGYQIDQIRNLIAHWAVNYDYLFAVDSDIVFKSDTLKKLLAHDRDVVSGLYIQRKPGKHILEVYRNGNNIPYREIKNRGLVEIDGCGFGCVLVKSNVLRDVGYPQFVYRSAIDHANTLSEDVYFCSRAKEKGFRIFADTSILCEHIGNTKFTVGTDEDSTFDRFLELSNQRLLPKKHVDYLFTMKSKGSNPKVVYDIGASVLHWTREAINVWPQANFIAFEAIDELKQLYEHFGVTHHVGVLSNEDGKLVEFYQNLEHPGGSSYYRENPRLSPNANKLYTEDQRRFYRTKTLDQIVAERNFPSPDLIKMDTQGSELDILRGGIKTLSTCQELIIEIPSVEYNLGAPDKFEIIKFLEDQGFTLAGEPFSNNGPDSDYHFRRIQ